MDPAAADRAASPDALQSASTSISPRKKRIRKKNAGNVVVAEINVVAVAPSSTSLGPDCTTTATIDTDDSNLLQVEELQAAKPEATPPSETMAPPEATLAPEPPIAATTTAISVTEFCVACRELELAGRDSVSSNSNGSGGGKRCRQRGFVNTGNACYRNAVLQALLAAAPLGRLLMALADRADHMPSSMPVWHEVLSLAAALTSEAPPPPPPSKPTNGSAPPSLTPDAYLSQAFAAFQRKMAALRGQPAPAPYVPGAASSLPKPSAGAPAAARGGGTVVGPGGGLTVARRLTPQEDAMEFMTFLLETLNEEMAGGDRAYEDQAAKEEAAHAGWETKTSAKVKAVVDDASRLHSARANAATTVTRLFYGTMRCEVAFPANRAATKKLNSTRFEQFSSLMLNIPEPPRAEGVQSGSASGGGGGWSVAGGNRKHGGGALPHAASYGPPLRLDEVLERHFQAEQTDTGASKRVQLDHLPQVLVLPLNRFAYDRARNAPKKIDREIKYPLTLVVRSAWLSADLKDRLAKDSVALADGDGDGGGLPYVLAAVVRHHGASANTGHYTALCKDVAAEPAQARWGWEFDDAKCTAITSDDALAATQSAYIFVYTRRL